MQIEGISKRKMGELKKYYHSTKHYIFKYLVGFFWLLLNILIYCKVYRKYHHEPEYYFLRKLIGNGLCLSRGTVPILNITTVLVILPVSRTFNVMFHKLLGKLSSRCLAYYLENIKVFHMILSVCLVMVAVIHSVTHVVNMYNFIEHFDKRYGNLNWASSSDDTIGHLLFGTATGFSGCVMLVTLLIIWFFSQRQIRDKFYNSFLITHHLFLLYLAMMLYHPLSYIMKFQSNCEEYPPDCDRDLRDLNQSFVFNFTLNCGAGPIFESPRKNSWTWPVITLAIFVGDLLYRYCKRSAYKISTIDARLVPGYGIKLKLKISGGTLRILPGQYILLQCLDISGLEWHPFTVIRGPSSDDVLNLLISVHGDWTQSLYETVVLRHCEKQRLLDPYHLIKLRFLIDGPFPSPMQSLVKCERVICIAAGVGITPFISFLHYVKDKQLNNPHRIHLIWISKCVEQFSWFSSLLTQLLNTYWKENKPDRLQISFYLTQKCEEQLIEVTFKDKHLLKSRLKHGRPVWQELFGYWSTLYGPRSVDVFSCGPKLMNREVKKFCHSFNKNNGCRFSFTHEAFN